MAHGTRWGGLGLAVAILCGSAASDAPRARAEGDASAPAPASWVLDVRVVRVDAIARMTVEAASPWEPTGSSGSWTKLPWAELLAGLKSRGTTTLLCEQRVTALEGAMAAIRQTRRRPALTLRNETVQPMNNMRLLETSYVETGVAGQLTLRPEATKYEFSAEWEEGEVSPNGGVTIGRTQWSSDYGPPLRDGATLVLPYRSQPPSDDKVARAIEVYVLLTCARADRK